MVPLGRVGEALRSPSGEAAGFLESSEETGEVLEALERLEERRDRLEEELRRIEAQLLQLHTDPEPCPRCLGSGIRPVRGGLYGELQLRPCACRRGNGGPS